MIHMGVISWNYLSVVWLTMMVSPREVIRYSNVTEVSCHSCSVVVIIKTSIHVNVTDRIADLEFVSEGFDIQSMFLDKLHNRLLEICDNFITDDSSLPLVCWDSLHHGYPPSYDR